MTNKQITKYDLENRTERFAFACREFVQKIPRTLVAIEDVKQLVRSSGSVAANYLEANEALSRKDFRMRIMICRKEAKESELWLRLINAGSFVDDKNKLEDEANQLRKIFGSIVEKTK